MLPVGTKFSVNNGAWSREIVEKESIKYMYINYTERLVELKEDVDYGLVIRVK